MKFREKLAAFFYGRNGADAFYRFLMWVALILTVVGWIFAIAGVQIVTYVLYLIGLCVVWYGFFRTLSKDLVARRRENTVYLHCKRRFVNFFRLQKNRMRDRKTHVYQRCPQCGVTLRLPKKEGEHTVVCPKCKKQFDLKI